MTKELDDFTKIFISMVFYWSWSAILGNILGTNLWTGLKVEISLTGQMIIFYCLLTYAPFKKASI